MLVSARRSARVVDVPRALAAVRVVGLGGLRGVRHRHAAEYLQLAGVFRRRVELGRWVVGSQIPTIDDLAKECGVAKATIRQAVGVLEEEGLVSRFRAKGTFVNKTDVQSLWCEVRTDCSGLLRAREGAKIELTQHDVLPILLRRCTVCHGIRRQEGGLDLHTRATMLRGGKSGPAISGRADR